MKNSKLILKGYIFLLYLSTILPTLGAVDRYGFHLLFLTILNVFFFSLAYKEINFISFNMFIKNSVYKWFFYFFLISALSIFFSVNTQVSILQLFYLFNFLIVLYFLYLNKSLLKDLFNFITNLVIVFLVVEITFYFSEFFSVYDKFLARPNISGLSSNVNLLAFSITYKLPFIFFKFFNSKNKFSFYIIILFSSLFILLLTGSRASYIAFFSLIMFNIFFILNNNVEHRYIKIIYLLFILPLASLLLFISNSNVFNNNLVDRITINDPASVGRLNYYYDALTHYFNSFTPVGTGNWKLVSIFYRQSSMTDLTVPYHVHNDFLEILVEVGFFGLLFYLLFLISFFRNSIQNLFYPQTEFFIISSSILTVFLIDSFFNFPLSRPSMMILFIVPVCLFNSFYKRTNV